MKRKPTKAELVKLLQLARQYLGNAEVQSIPFALPARCIVRAIDKAIGRQ